MDTKEIVKYGIDWFDSLPEKIRKRVSHAMIKKLIYSDCIRWDMGDENTGPCLYWESCGESLAYVGYEEPKKQHDRYYVHNLTAGYIGNSPMFWLDGGGYGQWIDEAKEFTLEEFKDVEKSTRGTHLFRAYPVELIRSLAKLTVDIQDVRRTEDDDFNLG